MKPKAYFDAKSQMIVLDEGNGEVSLTLKGADAVFHALEKAAKTPVLEDPGGDHYPTGINAVPAAGKLTIYMEFSDGSSGRFLFPAPGKSEEQVAAASEVIRSGFAKLFATH